MKFTPAILREIHKDMEQALQSVGEKHGISFKLDLPRYAPDRFTLKVEGRTGGAGQNTEKADFERDAASACLQPGDYGSQVVVSGREYKLVGIRPKGDKYTVIGETPRGKRYKLLASDCLTWLGRTREAQLMKTRETAGREIDPELRAARRGLV